MKWIIILISIFFVLSCVSNTRNISSDETTDETIDEVTDETNDETVDETTDETIDEVTDETNDETVDETTDEVSDTDETIDEVSDTDETIDEVTDETNDETVDETTDEVTDEVNDDVTINDYSFSIPIANRDFDISYVEDAISYCENLVENGYDDWKLPDLNESQLMIKNCLTMDPYYHKCVALGDSVYGCSSCPESDEIDYSIFDSGYLFYSSTTTDKGLVTIKPYLSQIYITLYVNGKVNITSYGRYTSCIRGNPFATE
jgi:uncharacterized protein YjgD (DUF1641 family)